MENILNDKYYIDTKALIQNYITKSFLSDNIKAQLAEYYNTLNSENAMITYNEVTKIYKQAVYDINHNLDMSVIKTGGGFLLVGASMLLLGYIGKKIVPNKNYFNTSLDLIYNVGIGAFVWGGIFLMSVGIAGNLFISL